MGCGSLLGQLLKGRGGEMFRRKDQDLAASTEYDPLIGKHATSRQQNTEAFVQPRGEEDGRLTFDDGVYQLGTRIGKN